jgi:hypothetical protein
LQGKQPYMAFIAPTGGFTSTLVLQHCLSTRTLPV